MNPSFRLSEFLQLETEEDILEWWIEKKLPHPGCPLSFKMVQNLMLATHILPSPSDAYLDRRAKAIKELIGNVMFDCPGRFYFPYKSKSLLVPQAWDAEQTDLQLLHLLLSKRI